MNQAVFPNPPEKDERPSLEGPPEGRRRATSRRSYVTGLGAGLVALALTYVAHAHGRPITSALVAVFGVMAVGALLGARAGLIAGLFASVTFNLVFTDPTWTFTYSTADDLVPMIALTLSAVGSGVVAGRLRDRAIVAEQARGRVAELLRFSEDLQRAVTIAEVESTTKAYLGNGNASGVRLFLEFDGTLVGATGSLTGRDAAEDCWMSRFPTLKCGSHTAHLVKSGERRLGVLVLEGTDGRDPEQVRVFLPLVALAIQRCRLAEQLAEADLLRRSEQFKTALLSSVSHDLRTPLAAISASASSLIELGSKLDEQTTSDLLTTIQEQCGRLDRFTTNLLNLGRIEGGLDVAAMPSIDALEVLGGTLARIRRPGTHSIHRDFRIDAALIRGDESLLEQLFLNILENAVTHTPCGTSVRVTAEVASGQLIVAVEDDGRGIPEGERERIFDRFHQVTVDGARSSGSGLGLSIAKGFAELFGGSIVASAAHEPMRGARIEVKLPLADPVG